MDNGKLHLFRPHKGPWYKVPLVKALKGTTVAVKYSYIVDNTDASFLLFLKSWSVKNFWFNVKEIILLIVWCIYYGKSFKRIKASVGELDTLLFFYHGNLSTVDSSYDQDVIDALANYNCKKVCHITHFQYGLDVGPKNLDIVKPDLLIGEGDPRLYNEKLAKLWEKYEFQVLPFCVKEKFFDNLVPFNLRGANVVTTGTIAPPISDSTFINFYGTDCLQPERLEVLEKYYNSKYVNCFISNNYNGANHGLNDQNEYFKCDISQLYSNHKFAIVTSEIVGFPAIGLFEALVSGCVVISTDEALLKTYGMKPNIHYVYVDDYDKVEEVLGGISQDDIKSIIKNSSEISKLFSSYSLSRKVLSLCS
ncbi:hypothetical protein [Ferrimonas kyonanensis]|uniref:hypothetical protein n=1 Tax=Ferrimonas kyonanensis TaxID=364763 RepID=UPI0003F7DD53|nr:hypothetical protein [Ferrimonas kyonanensis]